MTDQDLVQQINDGDEKAFRLLVDRHQKMVLHTCLGFVQDRNDAEDLAQEIFVELYHSLHKFRGESKLSTWIYRIAVNRSLNFVRDNKRRKFFRSVGISLGDETKVDVPDESWSSRPDHEVENDQRRTNLYKAINSLPERQRVAFTLSKLEDLAYQDIAEVMGLSLSSVESLIHRAKLGLQKKLYQCYKKGI
ncbi:RNA polymerase sigma factor [Mangrovibacterium diazotrophicum]|uniref:RNA polymerase sigma-70 factor (ECF subfamily) n=1 Tax=Mangrovibacterium diazotrophicum TaxID=1261403 RepID=A0A419W543_9BACT|nr:sigma-70 family RNA polymerase sigma factor [Mangrovibacterium diazotrophicum]RKD90579.1 RNA polymerase sigma-70 factor (ECF subfamily) [Mangrovibacterium diazotrophicum]